VGIEQGFKYEEPQQAVL